MMQVVVVLLLPPVFPAGKMWFVVLKDDGNVTKPLPGSKKEKQGQELT